MIFYCITNMNFNWNTFGWEIVDLIKELKDQLKTAKSKPERTRIARRIWANKESLMENQEYFTDPKLRYELHRI